MNAPLVSVVIPAYNAERFLAEAVRSILDQSYRPLEVLVVDDGSTDGTAAVARSFPAVKLLCEPVNRGIGGARNAGIACVRGELLAFLDADDRWTADKLAEQVEFLIAHPEVQLVYGRTRQFRDASCREVELPVLVSNAPLMGSSLVWTSAFHRVGPFREDLRVGEAIDWFARAQALGLVIHGQDQVALERRIHDTNTGILQRGARTEYAGILRAHLARRRAA